SPMADGAEGGIESVIERRVGAIRTPATAPGKDRFFIGGRRVEYPGLDGGAVISRHGRGHRRASIVVAQSIQRDALDSLNGLHARHAVRWRSEHATQCSE